MKINEIARRTGVTTRTLRYYDQIGLLTPSSVTEAGYREYDAAAIDRLAQILCLKELEIPLEQIKAMLSDPAHDTRQSLLRQKELLTGKKDRLTEILSLIDRMLKGERQMDLHAFHKTDMEQAHMQYKEEVERRYGNTEAYRISQSRSAALDKDGWNALQEEMKEIFSAVAAARAQAPDDPQVLSLVGRWQDYISRHFYPCTDEILKGLGVLYVEDPRFTATLDAYGAGTAAFFSQAIDAL